MSDSAMNAFTLATARLIRETIFAPLVDHFGRKGIVVTVAELEEATNLPLAKQVQPSIPAIAFGGAAVGGVKLRPVASGPSGSCTYVFRRGENTGKSCGKKCPVGSSVCTTHDPAKAKSSKAAAPAVMPGVAPQFNQAPEERPGLEVVPYADHEGWLIEKDSGLVVVVEGADVYALGADNGEGFVNQLNDVQHALVRNKGIPLRLEPSAAAAPVRLVVSQQEEEVEEQVVPQPPKLASPPRVVSPPVLPAAPKIPTLSSLTKSSKLPTIPSLSSIPNLGGMH